MLWFPLKNFEAWPTRELTRFNHSFVLCELWQCCFYLLYTYTSIITRRIYIRASNSTLTSSEGVGGEKQLGTKLHTLKRARCNQSAVHAHFTNILFDASLMYLLNIYTHFKRILYYAVHSSYHAGVDLISVLYAMRNKMHNIYYTT